MNIAIIGYGKMGRLVEQVARRQRLGVPVILDYPENENAAAITAERLVEVDVCVDFSLPTAVLTNIRACAAIKKNIVVGTTGWYGQIDEARSLIEASESGLVYGANFSIGMNLFFRIVEQAAHIVQRFETYDPFIHETHHRQKLDAPSGTALVLEHLMKQIYQNVPVSSTRVGYVPGTHTVGFDSEADTITLTHTARSRQGFAEGAVLAAQWLAGRRGFFEFREIISEFLADSQP